MKLWIASARALGPPLVLLAAFACTGDEDKAVEDDTDTTTGDADTDADADADTDADTDTDPPGTFSVVSDTPSLAETIDVAVTDTQLWAVGIDAVGLPAIVEIDRASGDVTGLFAGDPLVAPTGLAVSPDGATLFVADVAAAEGDGTTNGEVYSMPAAGGGLTALGTAGTVDLPGDVALAADGATLWVSGVTLGGEPAIFSLPVAGGAVTEEFSGAPLVDPVALAASPDGTRLYVVDSLGGPGSAVLFAFDTPGFVDQELVTDFRVEFPGGLSVDPGGAWVYWSQTNTTGGSAAAALRPALVRVATDGTGWEVVSDTTSLVLPAGVASDSAAAFVCDLSSTAQGDVFTSTY